MKKRKDGRYVATKTIEGQRFCGYGKTKALAQEDLDLKLKKLHIGTEYTFSELAEAWKDAKWESFSYGTRNGYNYAMIRAIEEFGNDPADSITPMQIKTLLEEMKTQKYSLKSVKNQKSVISTIFRYGRENCMCKNNPATDVTIPKMEKGVRKLPDDEDIDKVIHCNYVPALILLYTGCRRGEMLALTSEDIDFEKNMIHIDKEIIFESNIAKLVHRTKTDAGRRNVPLLEPLKPILRDVSGPLFTNLTYKKWCKEWTDFCQELDIKVTPHQLRHAYATMLYDAKVDVKQAQKLLGHSSIKMTMDVYTHIRESRLTDVTDQLNNFIHSL